MSEGCLPSPNLDETGNAQKVLLIGNHQDFKRRDYERNRGRPGHLHLLDHLDLDMELCGPSLDPFRSDMVKLFVLTFAANPVPTPNRPEEREREKGQVAAVQASHRRRRFRPPPAIKLERRIKVFSAKSLNSGQTIKNLEKPRG
ncbi:PREDICTED: uncharacterized protein LOC101313957 [Fragaria vesca subsp. vesca]